MKSDIIILSVDCNTHLHTLIKKHFFLIAIIFRENKGGHVTKWGENKFFGADRISGRWGGRGPKIWPGEKCLSS